jgi:hypothetical protein
MDKVSKTIVSAEMPVQLRDELKHLAAAHDGSLSAELRRAARLWVNVNNSGGVSPPSPAVPPERRAPGLHDSSRGGAARGEGR